MGFYPDIQGGKRGYNTDAARGADTFVPFSGNFKLIYQISKTATETLNATLSHEYTLTENYSRVLVVFGNSCASDTGYLTENHSVSGDGLTAIYNQSLRADTTEAQSQRTRFGIYVGYINNAKAGLKISAISTMKTNYSTIYLAGVTSFCVYAQ